MPHGDAEFCRKPHEEKSCWWIPGFHAHELLNGQAGMNQGEILWRRYLLCVWTWWSTRELNPSHRQIKIPDQVQGVANILTSGVFQWICLRLWFVPWIEKKWKRERESNIVHGMIHRPGLMNFVSEAFEASQSTRLGEPVGIAETLWNIVIDTVDNWCRSSIHQQYVLKMFGVHLPCWNI